MKKLKMGIIGFGRFAEGYLYPAYSNSGHAELIAITKRDKDAAVKKAEELKIKFGYSYDEKGELLSNEEIEAVFIATPNNLHCQDTIDALNAGKDVLLEKPMAMNVSECEKMIQCAQENEKKLMIAHCLRFPTAIQKIKDIIDSGKIGKIISGTADFYSTGSDSKRPWKFNKVLAGGGPAFDLGVHMIDTLRYLIGTDVKNADLITYPREFKKEEVELVASYHLNFENGIIGKCTASYLGTRNTFVEIFGTLGYVRAYDWNPPNSDVRIETFIGGNLKIEKIHNHDYYKTEIDEFAKAILSNTDVPIPGIEGLKNQKLIDMVNKIN